MNLPLGRRECCVHKVGTLAKDYGVAGFDFAMHWTRICGSFVAILLLGLAGDQAFGSEDAPEDPAPAFAGDTLAQYLERAFDANPSLKAFEARHAAALERVTTAGTLPNPKFQVTHFVEAVQTRTGTQENSFILSQAIPWFGKLDRREEAASAEAEALMFLFEDRQLTLAREVSVRFYEYGYTGRAIGLTRENLGLLQQLEPIVQDRVRSGGDLNSLLRLQVEIARMDDRLQTLDKKRDEQSARLAALLALVAPKALPWPDWEAPEPVTLNSRALEIAIEENNPALAMLDRKVASAEARRELARYESYPDLNLGVNYIQLGRYPDSVIPDAGRDPWGVSVGISLPIWGDRNNAVRAEAASAKEAAEHERRDREYRLKAELTANVSRNEDANRRLRLYGDDLLGLAKQALEITQTSYEAGNATVLEVIDSERSLLELQLQYWRAAADAWQSRVIVQTLANQPVAGVSVPEAQR